MPIVTGVAPTTAAERRGRADVREELVLELARGGAGQGARRQVDLEVPAPELGGEQVGGRPVEHGVVEHRRLHGRRRPGPARARRRCGARRARSGPRAPCAAARRGSGAPSPGTARGRTGRCGRRPGPSGVDPGPRRRAATRWAAHHDAGLAPVVAGGAPGWTVRRSAPSCDPAPSLGPRSPRRRTAGEPGPVRSPTTGFTVAQVRGPHQGGRRSPRHSVRSAEGGRTTPTVRRTCRRGGGRPSRRGRSPRARRCRGRPGTGRPPPRRGRRRRAGSSAASSLSSSSTSTPASTRTASVAWIGTSTCRAIAIESLGRAETRSPPVEHEVGVEGPAADLGDLDPLQRTPERRDHVGDQHVRQRPLGQPTLLLQRDGLGLRQPDPDLQAAPARRLLQEHHRVPVGLATPPLLRRVVDGQDADHPHLAHTSRLPWPEDLRPR